MPKTHFAIDIDNTLYALDDTAREAFEKLYQQTLNKDYLGGVYFSWDEWRSPADVCGLDAWMEVVSMCHEPEIIESRIPYPGAVATIQAIANEGYGLRYISTRSPEAAEATHNWLKKHDFPLGKDIDVRCMMEDKAPYLAECQYLIDDRPKTLVEFIYDSNWASDMFGSRKAMGLMFNYNRALTDIPGIFLSPHWAGLNEWMVRKKILPEPAHVPLET